LTILLSIVAVAFALVLAVVLWKGVDIKVTIHMIPNLGKAPERTEEEWDKFTEIQPKSGEHAVIS
jgi:hypothetical protein